MNTQTIASSGMEFFPTVRRRPRTQPFLEALKTVEFGTLVLTTPDQKRLVFFGPNPGPQAEWKVYDWRVLDDMITRGELGFADNYMDGLWDSDNVEALVAFGLMNGGQLERFFHGKPLYALWLKFKYFLMQNSLGGSRRNVVAHYDLGNDFYRLWLDPGMTYSCGLFEGDDTRTLEEAQAAKYARILRRLDARPGEHILEIGCGWGGFAEAAGKQGLKVTAVTLADTQAEFARERIEKQGLGHLVNIALTDYRKIEGTFDHVVSIGMFEHVGERYWPTYFKIVRKRLKPHGKAMIQSITIRDDLFEALRGVTGFVEQYIFPGGMLPSKSRFCNSASKAGLECKDIYSFGEDYATTLSHWRQRFEANIDRVRALGYDEEFIRLWRLYLASCTASFKIRRTEVMQAELGMAA